MRALKTPRNARSRHRTRDLAARRRFEAPQACPERPRDPLGCARELNALRKAQGPWKRLGGLKKACAAAPVRAGAIVAPPNGVGLPALPSSWT